MVSSVRIIYKFGQNVSLGHSCAVEREREREGFVTPWVRDHVLHLVLNANCSAHNYCPGMTDGGGAMAAII